MVGSPNKDFMLGLQQKFQDVGVWGVHKIATEDFAKVPLCWDD